MQIQDSVVSHIWISIQSDIGITMGELGSLSSETDSTLIATTLMALKDIVSIEASSGESQFMTGAVETSSFGTFAIPINLQCKLILSYIITAQSGDTIDDSLVQIVQSLCIHLGKQLTQFSFISVFVTSGAQINRTVIIKAFINASTLVRMEYDLSVDERSLQNGYKEIIDNLFTQKDTMLEVISYILGDNWRKNPENWDSGLLIVEKREKLYLGIAEYIIYRLANNNPLLLLYSANPRNEQKIVLDQLKERINKFVKNTHEPIINILPELLNNEVRKFITKLTITDMHRSSSLLFDRVVQDSNVIAITENPLIAFVTPNIDEIRKHYNKFLLELDYKDVGIILQKTLSQVLNERGIKYVSTFYDSFIQELKDIKLSQSAMAFLISFAQQFVTGKQLRNNLQTQQFLEKSWIKDINKYISVKSGIKSIKQLKVDSINEAVLLTNAAGYSIVNTIATILVDQFLITNKKVGFIIERMISFYHSMGGLLKASSTIVKILEYVANLNYSTELTTPLYQDLIAAILIQGSNEIVIDDKLYSIEKKKGLYYIRNNQQTDLLINYIHNNTSISVILNSANNPLSINLNEIDVSLFNRLINSADTIIEGIRIAASHRIQQIVIIPFKKWTDEIKQELKELISTITKERKPSKIKSYLASQFSLPVLDYVPNKFDERIDEIVVQKIDEIHHVWEDTKGEIREIIASSSTKSLKKDTKKIQKLTSTLDNFITKSYSDLDKKMIGIIKNIYEDAKNLKRQLNEALDPTVGEILKFQSRYTDSLLIAKEEVINQLTPIFLDYEEFNSEKIEQLLLSISLTLFDKPPDVLLNYAYNEVISGKLSTSVKNALNSVDSKEQFEQILKNQANEFASNIFMGLTEIINKINQLFISGDGIVTTDGGNAVLHVGNISLSKFPKKKLINDLLSFDEINFRRETNSWIISLQIIDLEGFESEEPTIVTFSDAVGYIHRTLFTKEVGKMFEGLANLAAMIEPRALKTVMKFYNNLLDSIFSLF